MLRDLPPFDASTINVIMNGNNENDSEIAMRDDAQATYEDPLDDVFGSAPSSPQINQSHPLQTEDLTNESNNTNLGINGFASADPSDIPRLRTRHVTEGYREGIAASKDKFLQEGFDEGFALGAEIGLLAGSILGLLEGLMKGLHNGSEARLETAEILSKAEQELNMEKLISEDFFEADGNWKFNVADEGGNFRGDDSGEDFGFKDVAAAHPTLKEWKVRVKGLGSKYGVDATGLR